MKYALISPNEIVIDTIGQRVAEVTDTQFEVAAPLFWVECADGVVADQFYYDLASATINPVPAV